MKEKRENKLDKLTKGAFVLTAATLAVKLLGLIYKIPLSYILSAEGLGYFNTAYTVYSLFYVISVSGVPKAMSILVPSEEGNEKGYSLYKAAHRAFLMIGAGLSLFLLIFSFSASKIIGSPDAAFSLIAIAPSILFTAALGVMRGYLNAILCHNEIAVSHVLEALVKLVFGIALSYIGVKLSLDVKYSAALGIFGVTLGSLITYIYLLICIKSRKTGETTGQSAAKCVLKRVLRISFPIAISAFVMSISGLIDLFLVIRRLTDTGLSSEEATAIFGSYTTFVVPMVTLANAMISPVAISFIPFITAAYKNKDSSELSLHIKRSYKMCAFISVPIFFGLSFFSYDVLSFLFSDGSAGECAELLSFSAPGVLLITFFTVTATNLEACGALKAPIFAVLLGSASKIIIGYFLIGGECGIFGASAGTVICYLVASMVALVYFRIKIGSFPPIITSYVSAFIKSLVMVGATSVTYKFFEFTRGGASSGAFIRLFSASIYFGLSFIEVLVTRNGIIHRQNAQKCTI